MLTAWLVSGLGRKEDSRKEAHTSPLDPNGGVLHASRRWMHRSMDTDVAYTGWTLGDGA